MLQSCLHFALPPSISFLYLVSYSINGAYSCCLLSGLFEVSTRRPTLFQNVKQSGRTAQILESSYNKGQVLSLYKVNIVYKENLLYGWEYVLLCHENAAVNVHRFELIWQKRVQRKVGLQTNLNKCK